MRRRNFLAFGGAGLAMRRMRPRRPASRRGADCGCSLRAPQAAGQQRLRQPAIGPEDHRDEGLRRFADAAPPTGRTSSSRLETNQGLVGWGEGTLEGKAGAAMACIERLPRLPDRQRSDAGGAHLAIDVRPHLLSRRAGDGVGDFGHRPGAVGHSRQSAGHAGVQAAGRPARSARRSRLLPRRRRAHSARSWRSCAQTAIQQGVSCFKTGIARLLRVDRDAPKIDRGGQIDAGAARGARSGYRHRGRFPCQDQPQRGLDHREGSGAAEPAVHRGAVPAGERAGDGEDRAPLHHAHRHRRAADGLVTAAAN